MFWKLVVYWGLFLALLVGGVLAIHLPTGWSGGAIGLVVSLARTLGKFEPRSTKEAGR